MPPPDGDTAGAVAETAPVSAGSRPQLRVVDLDTRSVFVAMGALAALIVFATIATSGATATLLALALLLALAIDPVVDRIQERLRIARGFAVALLCGIGILVIGGTMAILGPQTVDQAQSFQDDLPRVVNDLTTMPLIGPTLARNDVPKKIQDWAASLPKKLGGNTSDITDAAETITAGLLSALVVTLIMIALLIDGPYLVGGARLLIPPNRRGTIDNLGRIIGQVVGRYFAGSLLLAVLQGFVVLITGLILGVPLTPLLAVWAAVWNMVPQLGGAIGGGLFVLVAFTQGPTTGVIAAIVFMAYLMFANNVLLPIILGRAVNISPLTTMVATIAGFSVGGIVGAMLAVPLLGAGKAMYYEIRPDARPELPEPDKPDKPGPLKRTWQRVRKGSAETEPPSVAAPATGSV